MKGCDEKRVCVTGTTGYIGSWLVRCLLEQGYHVHATARDPGTIFFYFFVYSFQFDRSKL
jgi:nucleoside-diphosphate-sugar epimerase